MTSDWETSTQLQRRDRRLIAGEGFATPARPVTINGERLRPGRDRFAVDHPYVTAHPEAFDAAWSQDRQVLRALDGLLGTRIREIRASPTGAGWRLATTDPETPSWAL